MVLATLADSAAMAHREEVLWILFLDGHSLPDKDTFSPQDPYCRATLGKSSVTTSVHNKGGASPVWNELLELKVEPSNNGILRFELWDKDVFKDDFIGFTEVDISRMRTGHARYLNLRVQDNKGDDAGYLRCEIYFRHKPKTLSTDQHRLVENVREYKGYFYFIVRRGSELFVSSDRPVRSPFVSARVGSSSSSTPPHRYGGSEPTWNHGMELPFRSSDRQVKLEVKDDAYGGELIGSTEVSVENLLRKPFNVLVLRLTSPSNRYAGLLYLEESLLRPPQVIHEASPLNVPPQPPSKSSLFPPIPFWVRCINARNLPSSDFFKAQDPYVKASIGDSHQRTKPHNRGGRNPVWNETLHMKPTVNNDRQLNLEVWDSDMLRDDFIGHAHIDIDPLFNTNRHQAHPLSLKITDKRGQPAGELNCELSFSPFIQETPIERRLWMTCVNGTKLASRDVFHAQDPYVKVTTSKTSVSTKPHYRGGAEPVWNEVLEIPYTSADRSLLVEVFDKDQVTRDDLIGKTQIQLSDALAAKGQGMELRLTDTSGKHSGIINCILSDAPPTTVPLPPPRSDQPRPYVESAGGAIVDLNDFWLVCQNGKNLASRDTFHKQDPYVIASIGNCRKKTKTHRRGGTEPVWNEALRMNPTERHSGTLFLEAYDEDQVTKDDLIGRAEVKLKSMDFIHPTTPLNIPLFDDTRKPAGSLNCLIHFGREPPSNTKTSDMGSILFLTARNGFNLTSRDVFHAQDPFVKFIAGKNYVQTNPHMRGGANPEWNELLELPFNPNDRRFRVEAYDYDTVTRNDLIGFAEVPMAEVLAAKGSTYQFRLIDSRGNPAGVINCDISGSRDQVVPVPPRKDAAPTPVPGGQYSPSTVWVMCKNAKELPSRDFSHAQDPYVKCFLGDREEKTRADLRAGSSPVWNEVLDMRPGSPHNGMLKFEVFDEETLKDAFIGGGELFIGDHLRGKPIERTVQLQDKRGRPAGYLNCSVHFDKAPTPPSPAEKPSVERRPEGRVWIACINGVDLVSRDVMHNQDPYVKASVGRNHAKTRTCTRGGKTPRWDEIISVPFTDADRRLLVEVYDEDTITSDDLIGYVELELSQIKREQQRRHELKLFDHQGRPSGFLNCEISVLGPPVIGPQTPPQARPSYPGRNFWVVCVNGRDLPEHDTFSKQDPYVIASIGDAKKTTKVHNRGGANPVWNEILHLVPSKHDGILRLEAWDKDPLYDDFIGSADVIVSEWLNEQMRPVAVKLSDRHGKPAGILNIEVHFAKAPQAAALEPPRPDPQPVAPPPSRPEYSGRPVWVVCHNGHKLPQQDVSHNQDPFVTLTLGNATGKTRPHMRGGAEPIWNEAVHLAPSNPHNGILGIEAWDQDRVTRNDFIGRGTADISPFLNSGDLLRPMQIKLSDTKGRDAGIINCTLHSREPGKEALIISQSLPLRILCINGQHLPQKDVFHNQDPYVKAMVGNSVASTKPHYRGGASPVWNEVLEVFYGEADKSLRLEAWDKDKVTRDDIIGFAEVPLAELTRHPPSTEYAFKLKDSKGRAAGVINCQINPTSVALSPSQPATGQKSVEQPRQASLREEPRPVIYEQPRSVPMEDSPESLWVICRNGYDLPQHDVFHNQDPYVKVTLGDSVVKTKPHMRGGANPVWNETLFMCPKRTHDSVLKFEAWDADKMTHDDFIGTGSVNIGSYLNKPGRTYHEVAIRLRDSKGRDAGVINCELHFGGAPLETGRPEAEGGILYFKCINGVDLPSHDVFHAQDPYVRLTAGPTRKETKPHMRGGKTPVWNETLEMPYSSDLKNIVIDVWDRDQVTRDDFIGSAELSLQHILSHQSQVIKVPLTDSRRKPAGYINVEVTTSPSSTPSSPVDRPLEQSLWIACLNGSQLPSRDVFHAQDPFVKAIIGRNTAQTKPHMRGGAEPIWNEVLELLYSRGDQLRLEVYDYDRVTRNDLIGFATASISELLQQASRVYQFSLKTESGKPAGFINVELSTTGPPQVRMTANEQRPPPMAAPRPAPEQRPEPRPRPTTAEYSPGTYWLLCLNGKKLPQQDVLTNQDPFVKATLGNSTRESKVHYKGGANPTWNDTLELRPSTIHNGVLHLEAWDKDTVTRNDFIGAGEVDVGPYLGGPVRAFTVPLRDRKGRDAGIINCELHPSPPNVDGSDGTLFVACFNAIDLPSADYFHAQDPFVKVQVGKTTAQTKPHKRGGANPVWNECLQLPYRLSDKVARFEVYDFDHITRNDLIGTAEVDLRHFLVETTGNYQVKLQNPEGRPAGVINCECSNIRAPVISVRSVPEMPPRDLAPLARKPSRQQSLARLKHSDVSPSAAPQAIPVWLICRNGANLPQQDWFHAQDPYVKATWGNATQTTKPHFRGGANPVWDEILHLRPSTGGKIIRIEVWDADRMKKDDFVGSGEVDVFKVSGQPIQVRLKDGRGREAGIVNCEVHLQEPPEIKPQTDGRLWVSCINAVDLPSKDFLKAQDPFVKVRVGRDNAVQTKPHMRGGATPVWNEVLEVPYQRRERTVTLEVWDYDRYTKNDLIAFTEVLFDQIDQRPSEVMALRLEDTKGKPAGVLNCQFSLTGPPIKAPPRPPPVSPPARAPPQERPAPAPEQRRQLPEVPLWLMCRNATGLRSQDVFSSQDPYVKASIGNAKAESRPHMQGGANPEWNEVLHMRPSAGHNGVLTFELWDKDKLTRDDFICSGKVNIADALEGPTRSYVVPLKDSRGRESGVLNFDLHHSQPSNSFHKAYRLYVICQNAEDLPPRDWLHKQDPYVVASIGATKRSTNPHMRGGSRPVWNETLELPYDNPRTDKLLIELFDKDSVGRDDLISFTSLSVDSLAGKPRQLYRLPLQDPQKAKSGGFLNCEIFTEGPSSQVEGAPDFPAPKVGLLGARPLWVTCLNGKDLASRDVFHAQDPFVKAMIGKTSHAQTKAHIRGGTAPIWNETLELSFTPADKRLRIEAWDQDNVTRHDLIGAAEIDISSLLREESALFELKLHDGKGRPAGLLNCEISAFNPPRTLVDPTPSRKQSRLPHSEAQKYRAPSSSGLSPSNRIDSPKIWIACVSGRDLSSPDVPKAQDPYVKASLASGKSARTKPNISGGSAPVWNELIELPLQPNDRTLRIEAWDSDRLTRDQLIGFAEVDLDQSSLMKDANAAVMVLTLRDARGKPAGTINCEMSRRRPPVFNRTKQPRAPIADPAKQAKLHVVCLDASGLPLKDIFFSQDPYTKVTVGSCSTRTPCDRNGGRNPVWNDAMEVVHDPADRVARFDVYDSDRGGVGSHIGVAELRFSDVNAMQCSLFLLQLLSRDHKPAGVLRCLVSSIMPPSTAKIVDTLSEEDRRALGCLDLMQVEVKCPSSLPGKQSDLRIRTIVGVHDTLTKCVPSTTGVGDLVLDPPGMQLEVQPLQRPNALRLELCQSGSVMATATTEIEHIMTPTIAVLKLPLLKPNERSTPTGYLFCKLRFIEAPHGSLAAPRKTPQKLPAHLMAEVAPVILDSYPQHVEGGEFGGTVRVTELYASDLKQNYFSSPSLYAKCIVGNSEGKTEVQEQRGSEVVWSQTVSIPFQRHERNMRLEVWKAGRADEFVGFGTIGFIGSEGIIDARRKMLVQLVDASGTDIGDLNFFLTLESAKPTTELTRVPQHSVPSVPQY